MRIAMKPQKWRKRRPAEIKISLSDEKLINLLLPHVSQANFKGFKQILEDHVSDPTERVNVRTACQAKLDKAIHSLPIAQAQPFWDYFYSQKIFSSRESKCDNKDEQLYWAIAFHQPNDVEKLITSENINKQLDSTGANPLSLAAERGYVDLVIFLLKKGASINQPAEQTQPLHVASELGHVEIIKLLLETNPPADLEKKAKNGSTALSLACAHGQVEAARCLLEAKANPNRKNHVDQVPLQSVFGPKPSHNIIKLLLDHHANPFPKLENGREFEGFPNGATLMDFQQRMSPTIFQLFEFTKAERDSARKIAANQAGIDKDPKQLEFFNAQTEYEREFKLNHFSLLALKATDKAIKNACDKLLKQQKKQPALVEKMLGIVLNIYGGMYCKALKLKTQAEANRFEDELDDCNAMAEQRYAQHFQSSGCCFVFCNKKSSAKVQPAPHAQLSLSS